MVDVSKRFSGSPKIPPKPTLRKKWMSEPNLLADDNDEAQTWIKERENMEEDGVSFTEEVPELNLVHINKQRVQLRPQRRPPTRDFVRSRASMDFDLFAVSEEIREEEEDVGQSEVIMEDEDTKEMHPPVKPSPPPKPAERNGWRLPAPASQVVLRKTKPENIKTKPENIETKQDETKEPEIEDNINDINPESSPEKKHKERKRFKFKLKFRRSSKSKPIVKTPSTEPETRKTNLTETLAVSVDSGNRPLGEESRRRRPNRRSRKSEEKGLNWLLGLFHKRSSPEDTEDTSKDTEDTSKDVENAAKVEAIGNHSDTNSNGNDKPNGTAAEGGLTNGHNMPHEDEASSNPESVSDLRQKFERISAAF